jgi:flagellar motor switch protein FliG
MREPTVETKEQVEALAGRERAAIFMLALPEKAALSLFEKLDPLDIKEISIAMVALGRVQSNVVEGVLWEYVTHLTSTGSLIGTLSGTEQFLSKFLSKEQVDEIINDIKGPDGKTVWDKLSNVKEDILGAYLQNEYPQTIAVILSKITSTNAGKIISSFPEELAIDVINRMLKMEGLQKKVLDDLEKTLRQEFTGNLSRTSKKDPVSMVANIFNSLDRASENRLMSKLELEDHQSAEQVKALMFTFDDFKRIDKDSIRNIIRNVDKSQLALSLKGVTKELQTLFLSCMTERAAKLMNEEMKEMGMVRVREVDAAQAEIVMLAKSLVEKGEVILYPDKEEGDKLIG